MAARVRSWLIVGVSALCGGCDRDQAPPPPADQVVARVLELAFGGDPNRLSHIAMELRVAPLDREATGILLDRDGAIRVNSPNEDCLAFDGEHGARWRRGGASTPLDAAGIADARRQFALLRAALFEPLRSTQTPERTDARTIRLGEWLFEHDGFTPVRLTSPRFGSVRFIELGEPPALVIPRVVEIDGFGRRHVRILGDRVEFDEHSFAPPDAPAAAEREPIRLGTTPRPTKPEFQRSTPCEWYVIDDPGTWPSRIAACEVYGRKLSAQEQGNGGDPFLFREGESERMGIPFTPNGERRYQPTDEEDVRDAPAHAAAVVYAPTGETFGDRIAAGRALLTRFVATHGGRAAGPVRIVVNMFYEPDLAHDAAVERTMDIRLEQPVID